MASCKPLKKSRLKSIDASEKKVSQRRKSPNLKDNKTPNQFDEESTIKHQTSKQTATIKKKSLKKNQPM
jgi:hypothetical protein